MEDFLEVPGNTNIAWNYILVKSFFYTQVIENGYFSRSIYFSEKKSSLLQGNVNSQHTFLANPKTNNTDDQAF